MKNLNQKLVFSALLSFVCLAAFGSSISHTWRRNRVKVEECSIWQQVATDIMNEDVEGLQKLLEHQRLIHPDIADPIDKAIHIIEGPEVHHEHEPELAGSSVAAYMTKVSEGYNSPASAQ